MSQPPLWSVQELLSATGGMLDQDGSVGPVTGISIDTRTIEAGDLFVALVDVRDGHDFVTVAFANGAAMALVSSTYQENSEDGPLLRVNDPLVALEKMASAARARLAETAKVIAVTGSAGKTTTKEMLRISLAHIGKVHAAEKSYNNHWGVPLTLARMPCDTNFAVIEIGMNHAGEIGPLSKMTSPHIAVITSVLPVHLGHFSGIEAIAKAKAEIFEGLDCSGCAVIPRDASQFEILASSANGKVADRVASFGEHPGAQIRIEQITLRATGSTVVLCVNGQDMLSYEVGLRGRHNVQNSAACLTAWHWAVTGVAAPDAQTNGLSDALLALATMEMDPGGRGQVFELGNERLDCLTLIDESYNANPASMRAALENLSLYPPDRRKVAVIGDMLELGDGADDLHAALIDPLQKAGIDVVFACGSHMKVLYDKLPERMRGGFAQNSEDLKPVLLGALQTLDIVMIKGSNGSKLALLVRAVKIDLSP
ncbi:MAG: UDP-N-acetylmuramoyl-tripeptide--D-alanyl-D-alanine ligase [bacterium]|nr:UDP-N-acetylmuramoyl-tripeptide--D-alanyl-D-alanine ligase [bacterium]